MASDIVQDGLRKSRSLGIEKSHLLIVFVGLGGHCWREEEYSCGESGWHEEREQREESRFVKRGDVSDSLEVCDQVGGEPGAKAAEDNYTIDTCCKKTGRDLNPPVVDHGTIGRFRFGRVGKMEW